MKLNFNLDSISYLKIEYMNNNNLDTIKLALKEKLENEFIAIAEDGDYKNVETPQKVSLTFVCDDGAYKTTATLQEIKNQEGTNYFVIENPETLDYQQNREYYRILANYDCIYTIDTGNDIESFNATTYDISAGGVSIITKENIIPTRETQIVIFLQDRDLKAHLKFVRCEAHEDDNYKLSFIFTDLGERDYKLLTDFCIKKQLSSF